VYHPIRVDDDILELRALPKEQPYAEAGWRDVGVTSQMLFGLAQRLGRPVYVIHNDRKVYTFKPSGWDEAVNKDHSTAIVYNVWGDHAFFYKPQTACNAQKLAVRPVAEVPERCLAVRGDDMPSRVRFDDQRPFDVDEIVHYYHWARSRHRTDEALAVAPRLFSVDEISKWKGHWWTIDIQTAAKLLHERGISFYPKYVSAHKFNSLHFRANMRRIVISEAPERQLELRAFCRAFEALSGFELAYHGESMSGVGHRAFHAMFVAQRPRCDKAAVADAQQWLCRGCEQPLPSDFRGASQAAHQARRLLRTKQP
jgi:hypothetical protein